MEIQLSNVTQSKIRNIALAYGFDSREVIENAVTYCFDYMQARAELNEEFSAWDSLSDEAIEKFEALI